MYIMQIINEVTDNKIYTHKGEMIIACGINKDAGANVIYQISYFFLCVYVNGKQYLYGTQKKETE
jgi:hypothetical protein